MSSKAFPSWMAKLCAFTCLIIILALISALWINFGVRAPLEAGDKTVGLLVDYDELKRLADGSLDVSFADMLRKAAKAGANGLVVRERILADWETAGEVTVLSGSQLGLYRELLDLAPTVALAPNGTYILTKNSQVYEQLFDVLEAKRRYPEAMDIPGYYGIATRLHSSERAVLGLGFPIEQLAEAAEAGFQVIPRLRNWEPVREENLTAVFERLGELPGLAAVGFNDATVPGGAINPDTQEYLAAAVRSLDVPLVSFEFYDQAGLPDLAARLDNRLLRAHAIAENELRRYTNIRDAADRFNLAATERNIRYIYLRFSGLENPAASQQTNLDMITAVKDGLSAEGFAIGQPTVLTPFSVPYWQRFLLGAGVIAAGAWLWLLAAAPFGGRKLWLLYLLLFAAACGLWAFLLLQIPVLARKLAALAAACVFPTLAIMLALRSEPARRPRSAGALSASSGKPPRPGLAGLFSALVRLLFMSLLTFIGAMIMSALLAEPAFMLKLDGFTGVKASHLIPLVLLPCFLWLRERNRLGILADTARAKIAFWQLAAGLVVLAGLALYILRTGNESLGAVSGLEMRIRLLLDHILGVRPRTKEFMVGHPLMLVLLYFGYRLGRLPVLLIGAIGQISLINTYAHIHTPLAVSLIRSLHGLWIGAILGLVAIGLLGFIGRCLRRLYPAGPEGGGDHELA